MTTRTSPLTTTTTDTTIMQVETSGNTFERIENNQRVVRIGIDSGAGASVWPKELCKDYPTRETEQSKAKVCYSAAGSASKPIVNEGERRIKLEVDGEAFGARVQVAAVRKPLLAVSEMNDAGYDVHFFHTGEYYSVHPETGRKVMFQRRKGVYEIEAVVPSYRGGRGQPRA